METMLSVGALITVAAITPGPNNFIVLDAAMAGGLARAGAAAAGVVAGSLVLLGLVLLGLGALFAAVPGLGAILTVASALYVAWLGVCIILAAGRPDRAAVALPASIPAIAAFQIINPKAWALVVTAVAATLQAGGSAALLAALLVAITVACLALWALCGVVFASLLRSRRARLWLDRGLGALLLATAAALAFPVAFG
jgi:threonine/homoserine/homoserine lactone efflux protein